MDLLNYMDLIFMIQLAQRGYSGWKGGIRKQLVAIGLVVIPIIAVILLTGPLTSLVLDLTPMDELVTDKFLQPVVGQELAVFKQVPLQGVKFDKSWTNGLNTLYSRLVPDAFRSLIKSPFSEASIEAFAGRYRTLGDLIDGLLARLMFYPVVAMVIWNLVSLGIRVAYKSGKPLLPFADIMNDKADEPAKPQRYLGSMVAIVWTMLWIGVWRIWLPVYEALLSGAGAPAEAISLVGMLGEFHTSTIAQISATLARAVLAIF